jgi:hypothetical protein
MLTAYQFIKLLNEKPEIIRLDLNYNLREPKVKTLQDEIIDNVYESVKELNCDITYGEIKNKVTNLYFLL